MAHVHVDFKKTAAFLDNMNRNQIPFVAAVTLTRLAQQSQGNLRGGLKKYFTLRSGRRLKSGIRIKTARKSDFKRGTMHSAVFDIDKFMGLHVLGGKKTALKTKYVSIPKDFILSKGARSSTGAIKARFKPKRMIALIKSRRKARRKAKRGRTRMPRPFLQEGPTGQPFIAQRVGAGKYPLNFLWGFSRRARIKEVWPFFKTAENIAKNKTAIIFTKEFRKAIARG